MSNIDIVYLTFNRLHLNKLSLPALLNSDPDIDYRVHIRDNGSTDGTVEWLKTLDHPKIGSIQFNATNRGIAPVTNEFWQETNAEFIGKIDNDIIVPPNWIKEVMLRLENPVKERVGSVTLYHWIDEWTDDIDLRKMPVATLENGSKMVLSSHTGGNYIFHRYLIDMLGYVPEDRGLKGGFTWWQYKRDKRIKCGYVYPFKYFKIPDLYRVWEEYKDDSIAPGNRAWMEKERQEAKKLLELKLI